MILVGLSACSKPTVGRIAGEYVGHYGGATERLILRPDGTLWQELKKDDKIIYTNEGKWNLGTGSEDLNFSNFYIAIQKNSDGQLINDPSAMAIAPWFAWSAQVQRGSSDFRRLTIAPDTPYFFERIASHDPLR